MGIGEIAVKERETYSLAASEKRVAMELPFEELDCFVEYRAEDRATGVQFRDCRVDYTRCPNQRCIKKLV